MSYYDTHTDEFFQSTAHLDMRSLYEPFLKLLPPGGTILDVGCGSGRDSLCFNRAGFKVSAIEPAAKMLEAARLFVGPSVDFRCMAVQELTDREHYDGIWACASLLHVPAIEMVSVLQRLRDSLRSGGVLYTSYKQGDGERIDRHGRAFTDTTEAELRRWLQDSAFEIITLWNTNDVRSDRAETSWLNVLARKSIELS